MLKSTVILQEASPHISSFYKLNCFYMHIFPKYSHGYVPALFISLFTCAHTKISIPLGHLSLTNKTGKDINKPLYVSQSIFLPPLQVKCDQYWPTRGTETYGLIQVTLLDTVELATYSVKTFALYKVRVTDYPANGIIIRHKTTTNIHFRDD